MRFFFALHRSLRSRSTSSLFFSPEARLKMVRQAIDGIPGFHILDYEVKIGGSSYTIDTIRFLKEKYPEASLYFFLTQELLPQFHLWKEYQEILALARPLFGSRPGGVEWDQYHYSAEELSKIQDGMIRIREMDISSTEIRERLKNKLYCGHLVPAKVLDTIYSYELY